MVRQQRQKNTRDPINILAIESSCDETGIAIYNAREGLIANQLFTQVDLHSLYGGVVPELASRDHIKRVLPLVEACLKEANIELWDIKAVAYTAGPGLVGALLIGATFAKTLAQVLNVPAIEINHLEGHLLAPFLEKEKPKFPFLAVLISGGHSQFIYAKDYHDYQILGKSIDDAIGEAFDKTAKMLGLPYPGGRLLSELAELGAPDFSFTAPLINKPGLDLSFSGLKTAVLNKITELEKQSPSGVLSQFDKADVAKAFENTVVRTFVIKIRRCLDYIKQEFQTSVNDIVLVGGVSANKTLRHELAQEFKKNKLIYARPAFCVDNGAMIAIAGYYKYCSQFNVESTKLSLIEENYSYFVPYRNYTYGLNFNENKIRARWDLSSLNQQLQTQLESVAPNLAARAEFYADNSDYRNVSLLEEVKRKMPRKEYLRLKQEFKDKYAAVEQDAREAQAKSSQNQPSLYDKLSALLETHKR